mmetsp:Transcript_69605/g.131233  ORF Transcript_69605/g.131233 Transcript_69605/m.131233 type:complete len:200 (-) Transcript_69605:172-771(-)
MHRPRMFANGSQQRFSSSRSVISRSVSASHHSPVSDAKTSPPYSRTSVRMSAMIRILISVSCGKPCTRATVFRSLWFEVVTFSGSSLVCHSILYSTTRAGILSHVTRTALEKQYFTSIFSKLCSRRRPRPRFVPSVRIQPGLSPGTNSHPPCRYPATSEPLGRDLMRSPFVDGDFRTMTRVCITLKSRGLAYTFLIIST